MDVPGGLNLSVSLPLVIGTIPLNACASRTSSISSNCSTLSWLGLQERPEGLYSQRTNTFYLFTCSRISQSASPPPAAPPSYSDLAISEAERRDCLQGYDRSTVDGDEQRSLLPYITEFRYLPPPLYSEVQRRTQVWIITDNRGDGNIEPNSSLETDSERLKTSK